MSGKKKGLSAEEKRKRLLEIFYQSQDFFNLKDIEKIAQKEKGINSMIVKDIMQTLIDDNLVELEKIGAANFYWAFPSKGLQIRKRKIGEMNDSLQAHNAKRVALEAEIKASKSGKEESDERAQLQLLVKAAEERQADLAKELQKFRECDPEVIDAKKKACKLAIDCANMWTDNIFTIKSYCRNTFGIAESDLDAQFGLPPDLDYVE
eukprot:Opistho-2@73825